MPLLSQIGFCCCDKHHDQMQLAGGKSWFQLWSILKGSQCRKPEAGTTAKTLENIVGGRGLLPGSPSIFLSETAQTYLLKDDPADCGLLPSTSISNQGCSRDIPKAYLLEAAPQVRVLPLSHVSLICVRLPDDTMTILHSHKQCIRVRTSHHPHQYLLPTVLF